MISFKRSFDILRKDVYWTQRNLKLLMLMILPVLLMIFFSSLDSAGTFSFSLMFVISFIGIFSTSYLVIEEKRKGTLLSLLTTPLTGGELLFGKFLFNLILCLLLSMLVAAVNGRWDIILNPFVLLNILFFAGTACFVGFVMGLFFKSEQEMSVVAPVLMTLFCFGDVASKLSKAMDIHGFFPDYHLFQLTQGIDVNAKHVALHTVFSLLYFVATFVMAMLYTNFYFSNNRERRFSFRLAVSISVFLGLLVVSGFVVNRFEKKGADELGMQKQILASKWFDGSFLYAPQKMNLLSPLENKNKKYYPLELKDKPFYKFIVSIRKRESDEAGLDQRTQKIIDDRERTLISEKSEDYLGLPSRQWVYSNARFLVFLQEVHCGDEALQVAMDIEHSKIKRLQEALDDFVSFTKNFEMRCKES